MMDNEFNFPELKKAFGQATSATIAMCLYEKGLANTVLNNVKPLTANARFIAQAVTLRLIPARADTSLQRINNQKNPQRLAIESISKDNALVIDARGETSAGTLGGILAERAHFLGAKALITDGAFRDIAEISAIGIPAFAKNSSPGVSHQVHTAVDYQVPISCAGVAIYPQDILVGDKDGVVVIPKNIAMEIASMAAKKEKIESQIKQLISNGQPLHDCYPPSNSLYNELSEQSSLQSAQQIATELGIDFPEQPAGYLNMCTRVGHLLMTSGHCSKTLGQVGGELDIETAQLAAKEALILLLQSVYHAHGTLDGLRFVKLLGCVNSVQNFSQQHLVINGASEVIHQIFGRDSLGFHARSALGFSGLPTGAAIELEAILEVI